MGLFNDEVTAWYSPIAIDGKPDLKSLSKSIKLLIGINDSELSSYNAYLIALFSIFIPIYIALWNFKIPILPYFIIMELNAIGVALLLNKIRDIKKCNESMIEQYNSIQSKLGGSFLVKIKGKKKDVLRQFNEWNKKYHFKPLISKTILKTPFT